MKTANKYLEQANAAVPRIPGADAISKHGSNAVFMDVRDSSAIAQSGTIAGAQRVPRGMLEFMADETHQFHNKILTKESNIYIVCGAGGQAALAGNCGHWWFCAS